MSVNGTETPSDLRPMPGSPPEGKAPRSAPATKAIPGKIPGTRRRRGTGADTSAEGDDRFFLAAQDGDGGVPAFGRECASEAEAIIEAFRARVNFYQISEYGTRADVGASRRPVLQKEVIRRTHRQTAS
jgi:hypothetical protein